MGLNIWIIRLCGRKLPFSARFHLVAFVFTRLEAGTIDYYPSLFLIRKSNFQIKVMPQQTAPGHISFPIKYSKPEYSYIVLVSVPKRAPANSSRPYKLPHQIFKTGIFDGEAYTLGANRLLAHSAIV